MLERMDLKTSKAVELFTLALLEQQVQRVRGIVHENNSIRLFKLSAT